MLYRAQLPILRPMKRILYTLLFFLLVYGCRSRETEGLKTGLWHGILEAMDGEQIPFTFRLESTDPGYAMDLYNAGEVLIIEDIRLNGDSIHIAMPVFEGYLSGTFDATEIQGTFIEESRKRAVPFRATYGERPRFEQGEDAAVDISGNWEAIFSPQEEESHWAKGVFTQKGNEVNGTFRSSTGDKRYLAGIVSGDSMKLATFDGAHAYLFTARVTDSLMEGMYFSGNHFKEPFIARRNPAFELPDEYGLTYLKEGYDLFTFTFPDSKGRQVSLDDPRYQNTVVIVQLMGTWCPNCLDETKFLVNYLKSHETQALEVVALAFEYAGTREKAFEGIQRLVDRVAVSYPVLLAQYGGSNKLLAAEKLPMLNHVLSYPTTIYIDKQGTVRRIHTGFNGPATGERYEAFKQEFDSFVKTLLQE